MRPSDRLRVVHLITSFSMGGATENTLLSVAGLSALGTYEVSILAGPPNKAEGGLLEAAERLGVRVELIPTLQRDISPISDVRAFVALIRLLREGGYDIVHTHASKAGILGRLAARLAGVPVVVHTFHSLPYSATSPAWQRILYSGLERMAARWSEGLLSVTKDVIRRLEEDGIARPGECALARSGMDLDRFLFPEDRRDEIRARWGVSPTDVAVGTIGRVHTGKGQDVLVRLAPRICRSLPGVRLVIIGTGPMREVLAEKVRQDGLADRVVFVGAVPLEEMPETISALDILVHVSAREGLARVIMQALACKKPVISYDLDGSPEVITDKVNGRLVRPGDPDALVCAIMELAADAALRAAWGAKGPAAVDPEFRAETMVRQIDAAYRVLMRSAGLPLPPAREVPPFQTWGRAAEPSHRLEAPCVVGKKS